jgi:hypothetical protein
MADAPHPPDIRIHDWTRVGADTWHPFHLRWISEMERSLNGCLPPGYYADPERSAPPYIPDILTLQEATDEIMDDVEDDASAGVATAPAVATEPKLTVHLTQDATPSYTERRIAIRHESGDRLVAILELSSPANKDRPKSVEKFVKKTIDALASSVHVSVIDLLPPTPHDAPGLITRCAEAADLGELIAPPGKPLMIGAFNAHIELWAEPLAVGDALPDLPIFYREDRFVNIPLAATYAAAWEATPKRWRKVIEAA